MAHQEDTEETTQIESTSACSPVKKVKRSADRQLTKDDYEDIEGEEHGNHATGSSSSNGGGTFARADEATLKARKIVKVSKKFVAKIQEDKKDITDNGGGEKEKEVLAEDDTKEKEETPKSALNPFATFSLAKEGVSNAASAPTPSGGLSFASSVNANPFASIASSTGAGFGFGNAPKGESSKTGFGTTSDSGNEKGDGTTKTPVTLSFASSANTNPFAAVAASAGSSSSGFGTFGSFKAPSDSAKNSSPATESPNEASADKETNHSIALLSAESNVANGEEEEECIMECRAKLFRLTQKIEKTLKVTPTEEIGGSIAASQSGPPNLSSLSKKDENDKLKAEAVADGANESSNTTKEQKQGKAGHDTEWREVGIGPVRLLRTKSKDSQPSTRVVMRRETHPGGAGTKVILNVKLISLSNVSRSGDKFVRLTIVTESLPVNYLFKLKTVDEVEMLIKQIKDAISEA